MVYINYVSNLATQNPGIDKEVYVQAYSAFNDGGGGYFVWRLTAQLPPSQTPNAGIWFYGSGGSGGGGLWERQFSNEGPVNVRWFGAKGDNTADDTIAIQNTINFASSFGYNVFIPKGNYLVDTVLLKSNVLIFGEGDLSALQFKVDATNYIFFVDTQNGSTNNNIQNVRISNLSFSSLTTTFSEFKCFLCLNGVSNLIIENCLFKQFRGDAIRIGAGVGVNTHITHNENVTIRDCRFDGVTQANRNAISILDCNHLLIENSYFENTTQSNMPGAIDIEPDAPLSGLSNEILKNIIVQNNYFFNIGGNLACCSVVLPQNDFAVPPSGIYFLNNYLENVTGGFVFIYRYIPAGGIDTKNKIPYFVQNNIIKNASSGFSLYGACQAQILGNYINTTNNSIIGYINPTDIATDVIVTNNYFDKCGSVGAGIGLILFNCKRVKLNSNTFNDCGTGTPGTAIAVDFANGTSDYISFEQNIFLSPTGKTQIAILKEVAHTFSNIRNNRFLNNQLGLLTTYFQYVNDNNFGLATMSPAASVIIAHNMGKVPSWATVQAQSNNIAGIKNITVDSINITVSFTTTPVGTISLYWSVQA